MWSFLRNVLVRGAAIQQDYAAGNYKSYEEYSARLDAVARELSERIDFTENRVSVHGDAPEKKPTWVA